jgi:hypothetical protein
LLLGLLDALLAPLLVVDLFALIDRFDRGSVLGLVPPDKRERASDQPTQGETARTRSNKCFRKGIKPLLVHKTPLHDLIAWPSPRLFDS